MSKRMVDDQQILFSICTVYSKQNLLCKPFFENAHMGLRETILENIDRFKERDKIASDKELARLSGVPQSTFSKLRNQKQETISFVHIERLAHFFMTDPARLFVKELTITNKQLEAHLLVAEKLTEAELGPLTQTGLAFLESRKKVA